MATLSNNILTIADWAKRLEPSGGKVSEIVEMLSQTNEILLDMLWKEGNLPTGERTTVRTGLPTAAWRLINSGTQPSKSTTAQVDEACGKLEAWSQVDVALAKLNGNTAAFRLSEATSFVEAMNQEMASTLFYGNTSTAPEEFTGLAARYSSLSANNARCIVSGGGSDSANQSSIWLVVWGANTITGIFPKGSTAGLSHSDLGEDTSENANGVSGALMKVYRDQYVWDCGIALKDWRYVVRIPNIDISNLIADSSAADLTRLLIKATHRVQNLRAGKAVIYMNRTCIEMLDIFRLNAVAAGGGLSFKEVDGMVMYSFRGIPIRVCDALLETEDAVT